MNLIVRSLLFGPKTSLLEIKHRPDEDEAAYKKRIKLAWRTRGALGKLHNIVRHIRASPQRRESWMDQQFLEELQNIETFMLMADNETHWNSIWNMMDSAI